MPIAAPSALGARHSIVVRVERLLDSRPRRLRLSPSALGGALTLLALIAFMVQSVSPVLAYEPQPDLLAQASPAEPIATDCAVPNRGIGLTYFSGPKRRSSRMRADDSAIPDARKVLARFGASHVVTVDLTVDAAGKPRRVVLVSPPRYPGMAEAISRFFMTFTYKPALHNCVPVAATVRTAMGAGAPEPSTSSVIVPVYPAGWSDQNKSACKVPSVTRARFRTGFGRGTAYTKMLPAFPDSMKNMSARAKFKTSVRVHLNAAGAATSAAVAGTSGQQIFDDAVLAAARRATYPLTASNCKPLPTDYVWETTFERTTVLYAIGNPASMAPARR